MPRALVIAAAGDGLAAALIGWLEAQGWQVTRSDHDGGWTAPEGPLHLAVIAPPAPLSDDRVQTAKADDLTQALHAGLQQPLALMQAFAAQAEPAEVTPEGPCPRALIVTLLAPCALHPGPDRLSHTLTQSALWTLTRAAAQALAPDVRVNAVCLPPHATPVTAAKAQDLTATLAYLIAADSVTGQVINLST